MLSICTTSIWLFTRATCRLHQYGMRYVSYISYGTIYGSFQRRSTSNVHETWLCNSGATLWLNGTTPLVHLSRLSKSGATLWLNWTSPLIDLYHLLFGKGAFRKDIGFIACRLLFQCLLSLHKLTKIQKNLQYCPLAM